MTQIKDDLTIEELRKAMSYLKDGDRHQENVADAVHTLLQRPENVFYRDLGHGRGMWIARNNTVICPRTPKPTAWYLGGCKWKEYNSESDAEADVRNLAKGMSYKWAVLNLMYSLIERSYLVNLLLTNSGNTVPISWFRSGLFRL